MDLAITLLDQDNEDNALICLKIIIDLQRNYRPSSPDHVRCSAVQCSVALCCAVLCYAYAAL